MSRLWLFVVLLLSGSAARSECNARLQLATLQSISPWLAEDLAHGGSLQQSLDVRVSAAGGCPALLLGVSVALPEGVRGRVSVRSAPNGGDVGSAPGAGQPLLALSVDGAGNASASPVLDWSAEGQSWPAGRQMLTLRWRLYAAASVLPQALTELETRVQADIPAVLDVSLIASGTRQPLAGANATLDFGEVTSGDERSAEIEIRGNARAQLALSRRWGELRLPTRPEYSIPYRLLVDGQPSAGDGSSQPLALSGEVARARLSVVIGDVERRAAGVYEDAITIVVAPE